MTRSEFAPPEASGVDAAVDAPLQLDPSPFVDIFSALPRRIWATLLVVVVGILLAIVLGAFTKRVLVRLGVPEAIEGTAFERTAREFDTSTVEVLGTLVRFFILGVTFLAVLSVANIAVAGSFWGRAIEFLPQLFFAIVILIVGIVVGDKVQLIVGEWLTGIKIAQIGVFPRLAKFTVFYVAVLIALSQLGVATLALLVLLAAYLFAVVFLTAIALSDLLKSGAAGSYLLLNQPFTIGDEVRIGETRGIVQEVNLFVTHVENDGEEFIVPNSVVFEDGVVRIRE
ncbi:mechanosensitive ion channel domain-containing protein [Halobellus marinus]|jgi:small-conductance mechanosensitive channel|uniref:mechanosensitive ion channel domain-containing protein n=1 Tax=Halobellus TaxID=1073986 RepID=UPI0028B24B16|nr:mechanosensitive ion channel domain-containing protein [Halobellus sp. DFY28]